MKLLRQALPLAVSAALILAMTGCAGGSAGGESTVPAGANAAVSADSDASDICVATAGIPGDTELFSVNGLPVSAREYLYWLGYTASYKDNSIRAYGGSGIDWTATFDGTMSQSEYLKQDARSSAVYYSLVAEKAAELGCALSEEETSALTSAIEDAKAQMGSQEAFDELLRLSCLTEEGLFQLNSVPVLYTKLMEALFSEPPTDQEIDDYIAENDLLRAKHILLLTVDIATNAPLAKEAVDAKAATAEELLLQLKSSGDPSTLFDELMLAHSEDTGLITAPDGYIFTAGEMVSEFEEATRALEIGQISEVVESSYGYHIILRLDPDTEETRDSYRAGLMEAQMEKWVEEAEIVVTDAYTALDTETFYNNLLAVQQAFQSTEDTAEDASPEENGEADKDIAP